MGGPGSSDEIFDYLYNLFSDPYILGIPSIFRKSLAYVIASVRKNEARKRYNLIGGGSPIGKETSWLARILEKKMGYPVRYAMRYTTPLVPETLKDITGDGIRKLVAVPLYPQYSEVTSRSVIEELNRHLSADITCKIIESHYDNPFFIRAHAAHLSSMLSNTIKKLKTVVIFVAHSIPLKKVAGGDPYVSHIEKTANLIVQETALQESNMIAYQSHVGPVKWVGPSLEDTLVHLEKEGIEQVVVHPLSFVTENLETLYDLDIAFKKDCEIHGIRSYLRVPTPCKHDFYIESLQSMVEQSINNWENDGS